MLAEESRRAQCRERKQMRRLVSSSSSIESSALAVLLAVCALPSCGQRLLGTLPSDAGREGSASEAKDASDTRDAGAGDGDTSDGDAGHGDTADAAAPRVVQVVTGTVHTCARTDSGRVRCWGTSSNGELGYGNTTTIGDDELPIVAGDVPLGAPALQLAAGGHHTCAWLATGAVTCWGLGINGDLGYGNLDNVGDRAPANGAPVAVGDSGDTVTALALGREHSCALLDGGRVRCWGNNTAGQCGYATPAVIGDDETPASAGDVDVGGTVVQLAAGYDHTCARLASGAIRCWGASSSGQLGYGTTQPAALPPSAAGDVDLGAPALDISAGGLHTCAVLAPDRTVRCWGDDSYGQLGYGSTQSYGGSAPPAAAPPPLTLFGAATEIHAGGLHTCALDAGFVTCWGRMLVDGALTNIGDTARVDGATPYVTVGPPATAIATAHWHSCALTGAGGVRCWGMGQVSTLAPLGGGAGWLGYGNALDILDPSRTGAGDVHVF